jgi:hypothetical protein
LKYLDLNDFGMFLTDLAARIRKFEEH